MAGTETRGEDGDRGMIVNTVLMAAFEEQIGHAAYADSMAGVSGMTLPMARDLVRYGIRVVTVVAGMFETRMATDISERHQLPSSTARLFPSAWERPRNLSRLCCNVSIT